MKLTDWAKEQGISYRTAWNMYKNKQIEAYKLPTGTIIMKESFKKKTEFIITYARVSSSENKNNLEAQSKRLIDYCNANGWKTHQNIKEIGSGLNDKRKKLLKILNEGKATKLIIEHKDRLSRFGVSYIECLCSHINCELIVINNTNSDKEDIIQDFISVITSFCAKIYGQRRSKRKTEKLIKELKNNDS